MTFFDVSVNYYGFFNIVFGQKNIKESLANYIVKFLIIFNIKLDVNVNLAVKG